MRKQNLKRMTGCAFVILAGFLYATPENDDGDFWKWDHPTAYGISEALAKQKIAEFKNDRITLSGEWPEYKIRLQSSGQTVGYVRYNRNDAALTIHTVLPFPIPAERRVAVSEFFRLINEDKELSENAFGHYYVHPDTGECGFVRHLYAPTQIHAQARSNDNESMKLAEHWNDCILYSFYTEIQRILYDSSSPHLLLQSIKDDSFAKRAKIRIEDMKQNTKRIEKINPQEPYPDQGILRIVNFPNVPETSILHVKYDPAQMVLMIQGNTAEETELRLMLLAVTEDNEPYAKRYSEMVEDALKNGYFTPFWLHGKSQVIGLEFNNEWGPDSTVPHVNRKNIVPTICHYPIKPDENGNFTLCLSLNKIRFDDENEDSSWKAASIQKLIWVLFSSSTMSVEIRRFADTYFDQSVRYALFMLKDAGTIQQEKSYRKIDNKH